MHGSELQSRRNKLGLTQAQLSAALDIPKNTIARWERGELPIQHPTMLRLALQQIDHQQMNRNYDEQIAANEEAAREMQRRIDEENATPSPERDASEKWFGPH